MSVKTDDRPSQRNSLTKVPVFCSEGHWELHAMTQDGHEYTPSSPFKHSLGQHCHTSLKLGGACDWLWLMKCEYKCLLSFLQAIYITLNFLVAMFKKKK